MKKRIISSILCIVMLISLFPISTLALDNIAATKVDKLLYELETPALKKQVENEVFA